MPLTRKSSRFVSLRSLSDRTFAPHRASRRGAEKLMRMSPSRSLGEEHGSATKGSDRAFASPRSAFASFVG